MLLHLTNLFFNTIKPGKKVTHFRPLEIIPHGLPLSSAFLLSSHSLFSSPLSGIPSFCYMSRNSNFPTCGGKARLQPLNFLVLFVSSSLMFGQDVKYGFLACRLCGHGGPDLMRDRVMMGVTVSVQSFKEWRLPSVSL